MGPGPDHPRLSGWRASVARWLLLCVMVRALLPLGFMPELKTGADAGLHFVICSSDGAAPLDAAPGQPPNDGQKGPAATHCVFSGLASLALPEVATASVGAPLADTSPVRMARFEFHFARYAGPHVGARAPPLF